jgi:GT2 family glycosyltransferase
MNKISIIIPAVSVTENLQRLLNDIHRQLPGAEIILVIDNDKQYDKPQNLSSLIHTTARRGPGNARNTGAVNAVGDILIFIDSDILLLDNSLPELIQCMHDHDLVIGNIKFIKEEHESEIMKYTRIKGFEEENFGKKYSYGQSGLMAIKQKSFKLLNGFNIDFVSAEDNDFGFRAVKKGLKLHFCKTAIALHPSKTSEEIYRAHLRNKSGRNKLARLYPQELYAWRVGPVELIKSIIRLLLVGRLCGKSTYKNHPEITRKELRKAIFDLQWNDFKASLRILLLPDKINMRYH